MAARKDPLAVYNAKRDFGQTPEPAGKKEDSRNGNLFIVQKHDATRLHWDLRLEIDGVLMEKPILDRLYRTIAIADRIKSK